MRIFESRVSQFAANEEETKNTQKLYYQYFGRLRISRAMVKMVEVLMDFLEAFGLNGRNI